MMVNTILFRPSNDDPSLQLLCIMQYVGGSTVSFINHFPSYAQQLFSNIKCDSEQQRLIILLRQIFNQYTLSSNDPSKRDQLYDLLKQMFRFEPDTRIDLQSLIAHPFFSLNSIKTYKNRASLGSIDTQTLPIRIDDIIHLCTKLNLEQPRWVLTLKERCLFEMILHIRNFNQFNPDKCGLTQPLINELKRLIYFLTGNQ